MKPIFLYNPEVLNFDYGTDHPFRLERLWLTDYVCSQMGWFNADTGLQKTFSAAQPEELRPAHDATYLDLLHAGSDGLPVPGLARHGLGSGDNPVFPGLWEYSLHTSGGTITGASLLMDGTAKSVFHPGGGLHHAMCSRASGFCYVNDVVLGIRRLLNKFDKVLYLDLDAHHGDGVQEAFYNNSRVLTLSVHQSGHTLFPGTGFAEEIGHGEGTGYSVNVGLLPHMGDEEYIRVFEEIIDPIISAFNPPVIVTELGADALLGDPLTNMELGLRVWLSLLRRIARWDIPWLAVGGGGYDLANAMRAWSLVWAAMIDADVSDSLPAKPYDLPGAASDIDWPTDFWSAPAESSKLKPGEEAIHRVLQSVKQQVFSYHHLKTTRHGTKLL